MNIQCPTCGGRLAHYKRVPAGYCVAHSSWFSNTSRCASISDEQCSEEWSGEDFGHVCPIDGTRVATRIDVSRRGLYHATLTKNHSMDQADIAQLLGGDNSAEAMERHMKFCDSCAADVASGETPDIAPSEEPEATPSAPQEENAVSEFADLQDNSDDDVVLVGGRKMRKGQGGSFISVASMQKTAMWYYLKPRWILRRKAQAVVRRKVRSLLTPIAIKSSGIADQITAPLGNSQALVDSGGCENCGGPLPDGHRTTCNLR